MLIYIMAKLMKSLEHRGSIYAILSGLLYGFIGYFGMSAINSGMSASTMLFWRFLISSLAILLVIIPNVNRLSDSPKQIRVAFMSGFIYYASSTLLYFLACNYISSGLAMVIFFTYPVMIMLLNYFFYGQSIPATYYLATLIILFGMVLLVDVNEMAFDMSGILLGLVSAFFYACYLIVSKRNIISPNMSTLMVCLGCMTGCFLVSCFNHTLVFPKNLNLWINLAGIGLVATVIPILFMLHSLKYISSEKASLLSVLEPVFVVIWGVLLLGETVKPLHALGMVFILSGAVITLFSHKMDLKAQLLRLLRIKRLNPSA